jgi:hypothetical protein
MSFDDPASLDLGRLFRDPTMFDSRESWAQAGFQVFNRSSNGKIMVARHALVHGLLFKKYTTDVSQKDQGKNYVCRLEGARRLRAFVDNRGLSRIVVPCKWIVELPRELSRRGIAHVLIVEQLELLGEPQTTAAYHHIDVGLLEELCTVLFHFRGMDSNSKNLPFLADGRIGLIDTEHWKRGTHKAYLHHVGEHMSAERRKMARKIFRQLEDGRGRLGDFSLDEVLARTRKQ